MMNQNEEHEDILFEEKKKERWRPAQLPSA